MQLTLNNNHDYFQQKRFVAYLTAGFGDTVKLACDCVDAGVDILEIGVPFSDPIMDGPIIQKAMQQALKQGTDCFAVLDMCRDIKAARGVPIVLFSYYNPILQAGEEFYRLAQAAGVDATLIVDLPLSEQQQHLHYSAQYQLGTIQLIAPNSTTMDIEALDAVNPLFHYYACRAGTTGVKSALPQDLIEKMTMIRQHTSQPVVVGFGIANGEMAAAVCEHADGFVVGSKLLDILFSNDIERTGTQPVTQFVSSLVSELGR